MIENVKAVFWKDIEPVTFPDQPDVMDDLGLKKQRKQNKIRRIRSWQR